MNEVLSKFLDILQEKRLYPLLKKTLSILFNLNIASFLYKKFWGEYTWVDYSDYKAILNFLIDGEYFVPFLLIILVHLGTDWLVKALFFFVNSRKELRAASDLKKHKLELGEFDKNLDDLIRLVRKLTRYELMKNEITSFYLQHRGELSSGFYFRLSKELRSVKDELKDYFILGVQLFVLCILYFHKSPLFSIVFLVLIFITLYIIAKFYWIISILPSLIKRVAADLENFTNSNRISN